MVFAGRRGPKVGTPRPKEVGVMAEAGVYKVLYQCQSWNRPFECILIVALKYLHLSQSQYRRQHDNPYWTCPLMGYHFYGRFWLPSVSGRLQS